jgi:hypothetical protein
MASGEAVPVEDEREHELTALAGFELGELTQDGVGESRADGAVSARELLKTF